MGCGQSATHVSDIGPGAVNGVPKAKPKKGKKDQNRPAEPESEPTKPKSTYANFLSSHNAKLKLETESALRGVAFLNNGFLVVADYHNNCLKLFDASFQYLTNLEFSSAPWDVCSAKDGENQLWATVPYTRQVHRVALEYVNDKPILVDVESFKAQGFCWGVTCFDGGVAVSVKVSVPPNAWPKPPEFQVHVHEYDGTFRRSILYDPETGGAFFTEPKFLNVTYDDLFLLVSDYKLNSVFCVNNEDELIFAYAGMQSPNGIAMDENKDLHVTSFFGNQRVHKVGANGKYKDGLQVDEGRPLFPHSICYRKKDRIIVLTTEHSLEVYKLV
ncbi:uncharacterized protein LOC128214743 [Mya arenaria]|uniref:uncharacterized protein LOC128214743 n=1 Tax=Mya arenaria TaxID=6604 RepID=UPI0022E7184E|nr:uncharacterized protein LOC128214743 [Mya arenaria]